MIKYLKPVEIKTEWINIWIFLFSGAFLIPYFIAMLTCGIPLFLLEVSVGQYLGVGGMSVVGQLCPIFKGVGFSALMMVFLECVYYVIVVAWTLFYILNTFYNIADGLPWSSCEKGSKEDLIIIDDFYDIFLCFPQLSPVFENAIYIFH